jgi:hypothetical protein
MTAAPPLVPSAVYGVRTWTVVGERGHERLAGPHRGTAWPTGGEWLDASCETGHAAPAAGCHCGLHAWHPRRRWARRSLSARGDVAGIVEARGTIEVHHDGLRAQRARPYALVRTRRSNPALLDRLAAAYGLPIVDARSPDDLVKWCEERGLGLSEEVVTSLLGPRERERGQLVPIALRLAAVAAVVAGFLLLGIGHDPKGERDLYGRTGPVHIER